MTFDETTAAASEPPGDSTGTRPAGPSSQPEDFGTGRHIKDTQSICPNCLEPLTASVYERGGAVWMDKSCPAHGPWSALLASNIRHYYESAGPAPTGGSCCGSGCGAPAPADLDAGQARPWSNHSCTILIEIIERCNLTCPTCFAGSSPAHSGVMSLDEFTRQIDGLAAGGKRASDMIQLSGGEPTIHPQFTDMIERLFERGFLTVCINSNGIKLAQPAFVSRLARIRDRHPGAELYVYLQFDGFDEQTHAALRGRADLLNIKRRALAECEARDISVHPVMTLTRGINEHEVGAFVQLAVDEPRLKNVVIQPAMYSGRYDNPRRQDRLTLADTVDLICAQTGTFQAADFLPIPCSDPNCFGLAVALRTAHGLIPLSRYFPRYEQWREDGARDLIEQFTDTIDGPAAIGEAVRWIASGAGEELLSELDEAEVDALLGLLAESQSGEAAAASLWDRLLTISIKPFMDAWTYDQHRIDQCCVHILDSDGNPVSFCEFNAINRPREAAAGLRLEVRT